MATPVFLDGAQELGNEYLTAFNLLLAGIGKLEAIDGKRAQAIGDGAATMQTVLGSATTAQAQALSDRAAAFLAAYNDPSNVEMEKLRSLIDATFKGSGPA